MNQERLNQFMTTYEAKLRLAIDNYPDDYPWAQPFYEFTFQDVLARMRLAIERNSYHLSGHAFKKTCSALGIRYTYKAIDNYLDRFDTAKQLAVTTCILKQE